MTPEDIKLQLQEAGRTLRQLKAHGCWPAEFSSSWPDIVRMGWWNKTEYEVLLYNDGGHFITRPARTSTKNEGVSPQEIDRLDEVLHWIEIIGDELETALLQTRYNHSHESAKQMVIRRRKVLWGVIRGLHLRAIGREVNRSHEGARIIMNKAIDRLIARNKQVDKIAAQAIF